MAQQPLVGQSLLIVKDSRSHSDTSHSMRLPWTSDQARRSDLHLKIHNTQKHRHPSRRNSNPIIPASEQPQTAQPLGPPVSANARLNISNGFLRPDYGRVCASSILDQSVWGLWWIKWQRDRFFSGNLCIRLPLPSHHCPLFIHSFTYLPPMLFILNN